MHSTNNQHTDNFFLLVIFALAAILFATISGWQTYLGYKSLLGNITAAGFAVVTSLLMFFLNMALRRNRITFKPIAGIIIILFTVILVSFLGNFNAIYSRFAQKDLTDISIENAWSKFDSNMKIASKELSTIPEVNEIQERYKKLDLERKNLITQIIDPNNPGFGDKARTHMRNIESLLGAEITRLAPPPNGSNYDAFVEYATDLDEIVSTAIQNNFVGDDGIYEKLVTDIEVLLVKYGKSIENGTTQKSIVIDMKRSSQEVYNNLLSLGLEIEFQEIESHIDDLGEINKTLRSAFIDIPDPVMTIVVMFISLLIDLLIPLVTLAYYQPGDDEYELKPSSRGLEI